MFLRFFLIGAAVTLGFDVDPLDGRDFSRWSDQGRTWCQSRLAEWTAHPNWSEPKVCVAENATPTQPSASITPAPPAGPAPDVAKAEPAPTTPTNPDDAFEAIIDGMTAAFAADLAAPIGPAGLLSENATIEMPPLPAEPEIAPALPPAVALEAIDLYPGLAFELNRQADGLDAPVASEIETVETAELFPSPWFEEVLSVADPVVPASDPADAPTPVEPTRVAEPAVPANRAARLTSAMMLTGQAISAWVSVLQTPTVAYHAEAASVSR